MRICWAQYTLWAVIAVLGLISMLSGCGAKGELFLPAPDKGTTTQHQQSN